MNDVINIRYKDGYTFHVAFDDGVSGNIDFAEYTIKGPVFYPLKTRGFSKKQR